MKLIPYKTIKAVGYVQLGVAKFQSAGNIVMTFFAEKKDVESLIAGTVGKKLEAVRIETKFTPLQFSSLESLFPYTNWMFGTSVFVENSKTLKVFQRTGAASAHVYEMPFSNMTGFSAITLGSKSDPLGEFTITSLRDPRVESLKTEGAICKEYDLPNGWAPPALVPAEILSLPFMGILRFKDGTEISFDFANGATIEASVTLDPDENARLADFDRIVGKIEVSAKYKPSNISDADARKMAQYYGTLELGEFIGGDDLPDLELRGVKAGDFMFTVPKVLPTGDTTMTLSRTDQLHGEITMASCESEGGPKLIIGLADADIVFEDA